MSRIDARPISVSLFLEELPFTVQTFVLSLNTRPHTKWASLRMLPGSKYSKRRRMYRYETDMRLQGRGMFYFTASTPILQIEVCLVVISLRKGRPQHP